MTGIPKLATLFPLNGERIGLGVTGKDDLSSPFLVNISVPCLLDSEAPFDPHFNSPKLRRR